MSETESLFTELNQFVEKRDFLQALQIIDLLEKEDLNSEQREKLNQIFDEIHKN